MQQFCGGLFAPCGAIPKHNSAARALSGQCRECAVGAAISRPRAGSIDIGTIFV